MSSAPTKTSELHDAASRHAGRTKFGKPLVLEAGAGTGKTAVLVARVVHWCMGPGWEKYATANRQYEEIAEAVCEGVVAITFTDAAAVEMQVRVALAMRGLHRGEVPEWMPREEFKMEEDELQRRAAALLSSADRLRMQTIHSFCSTILRQNALMMGLHPRFEIDADGSNAEGLVLDYLGSRLDELYGSSPDADAVLLASNGYGPSSVAEVLLRLTQQAVTAEDLPSDPFGAEAIASVVAQFKPSLAVANKTFQSALAANTGKRGSISGMMKLVEACAMLEHKLQNIEGIEQFSELFQEEGPGSELRTAKAAKWIKGEFTKSEKKLLSDHQQEELTSALAPLFEWSKALSDINHILMAPALRLVKKLLTEIKTEMRSRGVQTYSDLLADIHALLKTHPEVSERIAAGMDQLLVDEFQDTDALQCELLSSLVLRPKAADLPYPDLFLVGDPKQSIYGWRNADLRSYHDFVQSILADGGEQFDLTVNFRSVPAILDEVERCIAPIMIAEEGLQPQFQKLHPAPEKQNSSAANSTSDADEKTLTAVEHWVSWEHEDLAGESTSADRARQIEAEAMALDLKQRHAIGEIKWADAAILMRSTSAMETYLSCLRDADIPFQVERDRNYYKRREIIDAAAMVRTIVDPNDQLALVTFLRSPVVGVPDAAWLPLWQAGFPGLMSNLQGPSQADLLKSISDVTRSVAAKVEGMSIPGMERIHGWSALLDHAVQSLAELRLDFHVLPADEFIHKLRRRFPVESTEAARHLGSHRLANLERFFRRLTNSLQDSAGGPQTVLRSLRRAITEGMDESEAAPGDQSMDAVRIMTIHKAKGLTFPYVYLVNMHAAPPSGSGKKIVAVGSTGSQTEFQLFGMSTLGWAAVQIHAKRLEAAERVRLLYVALTRPQYRLVMAGNRSPSKPPKSLALAKSMDALLQFRSQQPELLEAFQQNAGKSFDLKDSFGARWYFPNPSTDPPIQSPKTAPTDPGLTADFPLFAGSTGRTVAQTLQELQTLEDQRLSAKEYQKLPLTSTASGSVSHEGTRHSLHGGEEIDLGLSSIESFINPVDAERLARAIGTAVHRALELIDLDLSAEEALELQLQNLSQNLNGFIATQDLPQVVTHASQVLKQMDNNGLLHELFERKEQILGREIPILLPPSALSDPAKGAPIGAIVGTLDLLYRDPADGQLVIADFKTDQASNTEAIRQLAENYSTQGQIYREAVKAMFPDEEPPRFELWFLRAGVIQPA